MQKTFIVMITPIMSLSIFAIPASALNRPTTAKQWSENVDFWTKKVGTLTKQDKSNKAYISFEGAPYSMRLGTTQRKSSGDALVVGKFKIALGKDATKTTGAV